MAVSLRQHMPTASDSDYSVTPFMDYGVLIIKILGGFFLFCWLTTSNYLNSLHINTDASYPLFNKKEVEIKTTYDAGMDAKDRSATVTKLVNESLTSNQKINPYATRFDPGPVNMSNKEERNDKVKTFSWWWERTQQSSYQLGGTILHHVFDFFNGQLKGLDDKSGSASTDTPAGSKTLSMIVQLFAFMKWLLFGIVSNALFLIFLAAVFGMWIPGWLGGLTAFMPLTYSIYSLAWQLISQGVLLFFTFLWMCVAGWVTIFPVIYEWFYLLYLMFIKQLNDDSSRFGNEFVKRAKQLIGIYVLVAVIIAVASNELPKDTKITIGTIFGFILVCIIAKMIL